MLAKSNPGGAGVVYATAQTDKRLSLSSGIPYDAQPRLKLFPGRRNVSSGRETLLADEGRIEHFAGRRDRVRFNLGVPAQTITQRKIGANLPFVLYKQRRLCLRQRLGAGLIR